MEITKRMLKECLDLKTDVAVAAFFRTSKQAVWAWGEDEALPRGRQWQAIAMRPDVFASKPKPAPANVKGRLKAKPGKRQTKAA